MSTDVLQKEFEKDWPKLVHAYTDGASRGNPGEASAGLVILSEDGKTLCKYAKYLGKQTNNYAEYQGVLICLELCKNKQVKDVVIHTDSQLLTRQMQGIYKVKNPGIRILFLECQKLKSHFNTVEIKHIPRELNKEADSLANEILDMYEFQKI